MFKIDNFIIDRVLRAYLLDGDDKVIGYLDDLNECTIDMASETQDVKNSQGVLIRRFYRAKTASLSAVNSTLNLNVAGLVLGSDKISASTTATFDMPMSATVEKGETVTLKGAKNGTVKVYGLTNSGSITQEYSLGTTASATEFAFNTSTKVLTPPTADDEVNYFVYFIKVVESGVKYVDKANIFPKTVKLRLECQGYDICNQTGDPSILVIAGDNFSISPETSLALSGGESQTLNFNGEFAASYCSKDKELFSIMMAEDEED